ncbi:MAG TPA: Gfo/Idh/MocA family oxidoreductase [Tepidisphaeraceae bacterium]|nr:Gfo/Idh/MocA family oxidoreductase [Tepidisphaeraceae bacterium]
MVRIGIIGLGFMGRMHYGVYETLKDAQVVAVSDTNPKRVAGDLSEGWGNVPGAEIQKLPMDRIRGTTDWRELIRWDDVDVVDICLPTPAHVEVVTAALAAGKHVLCEKPLARTSAEARKIAAAAAEAKGFFMPAMCMRFWSEWEWIQRAIAEEHYGKVRSATFKRAGATPVGWFRDGKLSGGALVDLHIHDTDFIYYLFGKPRGVFSRGYSKDTGEIDHVVTQYIYDRPQLVAAEGAWGLAQGFEFTMQLTVNFDRATVEYISGREHPLMLYADGKAQPVEHPKHTGYAGEMSYFIECVKTHTPPRRVTADDAVAGLQIIEAEKKSIETGQVVVV